jgi:hypothetical protein
MNIKIALLSVVLLSFSTATEPVSFTAPKVFKLLENSVLNKVRTETGNATYTVEEFSNVDNLYGSLKNKLEPLKTIVIFDIDILTDAALPIINLLQQCNFKVIISSAYYAPGDAYSKLMELKVDKALDSGRWPEQTTSSLTGLSKNKINFYQIGLLCLAKPQSSPSSIYAASILAPAAQIMNFYLNHIVMVSSCTTRANFVESQLSFVKNSSIFTDKNIIFAIIDPNIEEASSPLSPPLAIESFFPRDEEEYSGEEMLFEIEDIEDID